MVKNIRETASRLQHLRYFHVEMAVKQFSGYSIAGSSKKQKNLTILWEKT